jgi:DNA (cytosine-5)-methyltransferase 1
LLQKGDQTMAAYYNEIDPFAAQWLRNLIAKNLIAPGDVDERSIRDVQPDDLRNYKQCHFFAGIGVWSYALRRAGWEDSRPVWTGSCPCQPFSAAGKQEGTADARHLWPEWFRLIRKCRPVVIFGEQVSAAIRHSWLDLVSADLEGAGYAIGSAVMGAHSVGAPHIRQRLFFVADSDGARRGQGRAGEAGDGRGPARIESSGLRAARELADHDERGRQEFAPSRLHGQGQSGNDADGCREPHRLEHSPSHGRQQRRPEPGGRGAAGGCGEGGMEHAAGEQVGIPGRARESRSATGVMGDTAMRGRQGCYGSGVEEQGFGAGRTPSFWSACDWLPCIDGKARPVKSGTFPLVNGYPNRVGILRAAGNAICAETAAEFIRAYREIA